MSTLDQMSTPYQEPTPQDRLHIQVYPEVINYGKTVITLASDECLVIVVVLEEEIYVGQPQGFISKGNEGKVLRRRKALKDDLVYIRNNMKMMKDFKEDMIKIFEMTNLGLMNYFLNIEIHAEAKPNSLWSSQMNSKISTRHKGVWYMVQNHDQLERDLTGFRVLDFCPHSWEPKNNSTYLPPHNYVEVIASKKLLDWKKRFNIIE
ncbi:hypothetical protein CR513_57841, partial [Mucuna pruriens]